MNSASHLFALLIIFGAPTVEHVRIVAMGDSTTAGTPYARSPSEAPPHGSGDLSASYASWMMRARPHWEVLNRGVAGERTDQIRARFAHDVLAEKPKWVVLLGGVNDIYQGRPLLEIQADLSAMYQDALVHRIVPIAASVLPFTAATPAHSASIHTLNRWIVDEARRLHIPYCDLHAAVADPTNPDRLRGSPEGLHPDRAGYRAMGEALVSCLEAS